MKKIEPNCDNDMYLPSAKAVKWLESEIEYKEKLKEYFDSIFKNRRLKNEQRNDNAAASK